MARFGRGITAMIVVALFVLPALSASVSAQGSPLPAVELDCGADPVMNVHPNFYEDAILQCTVTNPTSASEVVEVTKIEWDGVNVEMTLSEDEFTLAAGDEETFNIIFAGQTRLPASLTHEFEIEAKVTSWNNLPYGQLPEGPWVVNQSYLGDFSIESYGMVELLMSDKTTRELSTSEEVEFTFQFTNKGNDADNIRVSIANEADLVAAGFSFPGGTFISEDVPYQGTSSLRTLTVRSPSELTDDIRLPVLFKAESSVDTSAPSSEITVQLAVAAPGQSNSLGGNLEEVDKDQLLQYGAIGGGVILVLLLLVVLAKATKRSSKPAIGSNAVHIPTPLDVPEEEMSPAASLNNDLDDFFSDLDEPVQADEFDDLFDDL
ncbi:MAG: choice-of-anchor T family protein [Candidatus Poseidoniaceae archaeon]